LIVDKRVAGISISVIVTLFDHAQLWTLRDYIESLGGSLKIIADVAGKKVDLSSIAEKSPHRSKRA